MGFYDHKWKLTKVLQRALWQRVFCKNGQNKISHSTCSSFNVTLAFLPSSVRVLLKLGGPLWLPWPIQYNESEAVWLLRWGKNTMHIVPSRCLLLLPNHCTMSMLKPVQDSGHTGSWGPGRQPPSNTRHASAGTSRWLLPQLLSHPSLHTSSVEA
jgi:hypothetical protein